MWRKKQKQKDAFIQKVRHEHIRSKLLKGISAFFIGFYTFGHPI